MYFLQKIPQTKEQSQWSVFHEVTLSCNRLQTRGLDWKLILTDAYNSLTANNFYTVTNLHTWKALLETLSLLCFHQSFIVSVCNNVAQDFNHQCPHYITSTQTAQETWLQRIPQLLSDMLNGLLHSNCRIFLTQEHVLLPWVHVYWKLPANGQQFWAFYSSFQL